MSRRARSADYASASRGEVDRQRAPGAEAQPRGSPNVVPEMGGDAHFAESPAYTERARTVENST